MSRKRGESCTRCGTCCLKSGPALHAEDARLVAEKTVPLTQLVTLRKGEPAHDQVRDEVAPLAAEIVKIRGESGFSCAFYDASLPGCAIYQDRPAECRALSCRDPRTLAEMYERDRLTRLDLVDAQSGMGGLVAEHEARCPAGRAFALGRALVEGEGSGEEELKELVRYDARFRASLIERTGAAARDLDFFFGRPLSEVLAPAGLRVFMVGDTTVLSVSPRL